MLCLIISVIHASGRGERGGARKNTEAGTRLVQKELEEEKGIKARKVRQGKQDRETMNEESQPKPVIRGRKHQTNGGQCGQGAEDCRKNL